MGVILGGYKPNIRCDAPALIPHWLSCTLLLKEMLATKQPLLFGPTGTPDVAVELPYTITSIKIEHHPRSNVVCSANKFCLQEPETALPSSAALDPTQPCGMNS